MHPACDGGDAPGGDVGGVELRGTLHGRHQVDGLAVALPGEGVGVIVERFGHVCFLTRGELHHEETVLVRFITIALHALPGQVAAIGRELRVDIVAHHPLGHVAGLTARQVVEVDIGVGRLSILLAGLLARGVGDGASVGAPGELFNAAKGCQWCLVRFTLQQIDDVVQAISLQVGQERMRHALHPVVPVLVHQVVHHAAAGSRQVGILLSRLLAALHAADEKNLLAVGRDHKALDGFLLVGDLCHPSPIGIDGPYL